MMIPLTTVVTFCFALNHVYGAAIPTTAFDTATNSSFSITNSTTFNTTANPTDTTPLTRGRRQFLFPGMMGLPILPTLGLGMPLMPLGGFGLGLGLGGLGYGGLGFGGLGFGGLGLGGGIMDSVSITDSVGF